MPLFVHVFAHVSVQCMYAVHAYIYTHTYIYIHFVYSAVVLCQASMPPHACCIVSQVFFCVMPR